MRADVRGDVLRTMPDMSKTAPSRIMANRLRLAARRQHLVLERSRLRDPRAVGFGTYRLSRDDTGTVVAADLSLDGAEEWLLHGQTHVLAVQVVSDRLAAEGVAAEYGQRAGVVATRLRENDDGSWRVLICGPAREGDDRHQPVT